MLRLSPPSAAAALPLHRSASAGAPAIVSFHLLSLRHNLLRSPPGPPHVLGLSNSRPWSGLFCLPSSSSSSASLPDDDGREGNASDGDGFDAELQRLLVLLPETMRRKLSSHPDLHQLIEVVMDLGRSALARFPSGDFVLSDDPITLQDIRDAAAQVGDFAGDNRAGISRTLHRISAIRNRKGMIVGLTCRVGRAVSGSADSLRDLVRDGGSVLLIGPPGVGKTTIIREIARMLADEFEKRVMIVDTSNEIGGDGDIPHLGIGNARRMQVPDPNMQHKVLIEAVENHMPQAIVIDEIGTKLEAMAASTIAQRGIQLVATAHGITIENLIMNPSLEMLVGGIQSVTLGDEEASRRGVQKTVLERKGPSTFTCGVEIISKTELRVHHSLEATVDALLSGRSPKVEVHQINSNGFTNKKIGETTRKSTSHSENKMVIQDVFETNDNWISNNGYAYEHADIVSLSSQKDIDSLNSSEMAVLTRLYVYGILEASVMQAIKQMRMDEVVCLTNDISEADAFLALQSKLKKNPRIEALAKSHDLPIFVTKTSSLDHISKAIRAFIAKQTDGSKEFLLEDEISSSEKIDALEEARLAIEQVVIPKGETVELLPRPSYIISAQMDLVRKYSLKAVKIGKEPDAFLRILPLCSAMDDGSKDRLDDDVHDLLEFGLIDDVDSFHNGPARLPLLPD